MFVTKERSSFEFQARGEARVVVHTDPLRSNWDNYCLYLLKWKFNVQRSTLNIVNSPGRGAQLFKFPHIQRFAQVTLTTGSRQRAREWIRKRKSWLYILWKRSESKDEEKLEIVLVFSKVPSLISDLSLAYPPKRVS